MATKSRPHVAVIGAGVSGLTTALRIAEAGVSVRVFTDQELGRTTSTVAGATWGPYVVSDPRVLKWSMRTLVELQRIACDAGSGVHLSHGLEASREPVVPPEWAPRLPHYAPAVSDDLPPGYVTGWHYEIPLVDMTVYLRFLATMLATRGVTITTLPGPLRNLADLSSFADIVVNCTGLGSRQLVPDRDVWPSWGQLVVTDNPGVDYFFTDFPESAEPTYFIPHGDQIILGGFIGNDPTGAAPDIDVARRIIDRCGTVDPRLTSAQVRELRTGLRPCRTGIRLERERVGDTQVIHNYGHGGSGLTLSWGCANAVLDLLDET